ncbi:MAG: hypothetical protein RIA63_06450, partial [Cyclobacteriaceae bacterium]
MEITSAPGMDNLRSQIQPILFPCFYVSYEIIMSMKPPNLALPLLFLSLICLSCSSQPASKDNAPTKVWLDPALTAGGTAQPIVVWFTDQYLEDSESFQKKAQEVKNIARSELRKQTIETLKDLSRKLFSKVKSDLTRFETAGHVKNIKQHWIINGFSCEVDSIGLNSIQKMEGVSKIFQKQPIFNPSNPDIGPEYLSSIPASRFAVDKVESYPWNIEQIRAPEVWKKYGVTGKGTLNVVHDFGFKLDIPPLAETIYTNTGEIPGNNIDDDKNGFIDDYHGYNFDEGSSSLNNPGMNGTIIHGNACAAMISGTFATNTNQAIGIAPESKWAP